MTEDTRRVLELLAQGKITVDEADRLLRAIATPPAGETSASGASAASGSGTASRKTPRFIRIAVHKGGGCGRPDDVNIRVPIAVVKGGMRLGAIVPGLVGDKVAARLRERGLDVDFSKLDPAAIDAVLRELGDVGIDVDAGKAQVRITCE
jgi:SHOCT-like protein